MPNPINPRDPFDQFFSNRVQESDAFSRLLSLDQEASISPFGFHGVSGSGKTWLAKRFSQLSSNTHGVSNTTLELNNYSVGTLMQSPDTICSRLIGDLRLDAPRTTLALLHLLSRERSDLFDRKDLIKEFTSQGIGSFIDSAAQNFQSFSPGALAGTAIKALWTAKEKWQEPLNVFLRSSEGNSDNKWLTEHDDELIRTTLFDRLGNDLLLAKSGHRSNSLVQNVVFIDATEYIRSLNFNTIREQEALAWIPKLWEACCRRTGDIRSPMLLIIPFGQIKLDWSGVWGTTYESISLEGFSTPDAEEYLRDKRKIQEPATVRDILSNSLESKGVARHHILSLGLGADVESLSKKPNVTEQQGGHVVSTTDLEHGLSIWDYLFEKFFRLSSDLERGYLLKLAITPIWDKNAFAHAMGVEESSVECQVAWERLVKYSFVSQDSSDSFRFHELMIKSSLTKFDESTKSRLHQDWVIYWFNRMETATDSAGRSYWYHAYLLSPAQMVGTWKQNALEHREDFEWGTHWDLVQILGELLMPSYPPSSETVDLFMNYASELQYLYVGNRRSHLQRAIDVYNASVQWFPPRSEKWAALYNNLGSALQSIQGADQGEHLILARKALENALMAFEPGSYEWGMTHLNIGNTYSRTTPKATKEDLLKAIEAYQVALTVCDRDSADWATIMNNTGNAYHLIGDDAMPGAVDRAIACYRSALQIYGREQSLSDWARTMGNLAGALMDRKDGDALDNLQKAYIAFSQVLRVYSEEDAPWLRVETMHNMAICCMRGGLFKNARELLVNVIEVSELIQHQHALITAQEAMRILNQFESGNSRD